MQKILQLKLLPSEAANDHSIKNAIAEILSVNPANITGYLIQKRSVDARSRQPVIQLKILSFVNEPFQNRQLSGIHYRDVKKSNKKVIIIGAGPAGLFAALRLLEEGIKPVILERGKDVRARRRDLARLNKEGTINPDSNYCFGEGGAGTYSDGKLYTRSSKRGDVDRILAIFNRFGAHENILYESHPHIGTNKLPGIIAAMRQQIMDCGGEIHFHKKLSGLEIENEMIRHITTLDGDYWEADAFILATGHSARDIYLLLKENHLQIEFKPFALGVRVEHPQELIDRAQYHCAVRDKFLPPAAYSWVQQVEARGVFSFCMCPGGIIAPASTDPGELVVNGWSPSKRNNPFANSGIVVPVDEKDVHAFKKYGPLAGMYFQQAVEQKAFRYGGGRFRAPAQRLVDFLDNKISTTFPECSYLPGIQSAGLQDVLPKYIFHALQKGFRLTGRSMKGYLTNEAIVVATESRTSSPVRIPRTSLLHHPQLKNLFPCGEGAGYAGGIVSAAMDGERVAELISMQFHRLRKPFT